MKKYISLIENPVSIISDNCWGGNIYSYLGLRFDSPFINLSLETDDYIKLLRNLEFYLSQELKLVHDRDIGLQKCPVGSLGNGEDKIEIKFIHYGNFKIAKEKWEKRKKRINKNNLLIKMTLIGQNDEVIAKEFDNLPYSKKIFFSAKKFNYESCVYMPKFVYEQLHNKYVEFLNLYVLKINRLEQSCNILQLVTEGKDFLRTL